MKATLKRLFPTLAAMPAEKWMVMPLAVLLVVAVGAQIVGMIL